jgi:hypothetical protein
VDLAGTSQANYPEVRPSSLLSKKGNCTPKLTREKDGSKGNVTKLCNQQAPTVKTIASNKPDIIIRDNGIKEHVR